MHKHAHRIEDLVRQGPFGRSHIYKEIAAGRLIARKSGRATIILDEDFRCYLEKVEGDFFLKELKLKLKNKWYDYVKVSEVGFSSEEIEWGFKSEKEFISLPRKFKKNIITICSKALE